MMRRWKSADFIVAFMLSIAYFFIALLNWLAPYHSPLLNGDQPTDHPWLSLIYFIVAVAITWTIYFFSKKRAKITSFFVAIIVGIILIFVGIFMWKIADRYDDNGVTTSEVRSV